MIKKFREWIHYRFVRKEKKIAERGRAFVPRRGAVAQPTISVSARKLNSKDGTYENVPVTNVRLEKLNG